MDIWYGQSLGPLINLYINYKLDFAFEKKIFFALSITS